MAFQNIDQQVIEAGMEVPQLYFSDIAQNEDILRPQEEAILGSPVRIRELVNRLERLRKTHRYIKSLDIFYEGTGTVVTGFTAVHQIDTETEIRKYLPWYDTFAASGEETLFLENTQGIYPTNEAVITFVKKIALPKWKGRGIILAIHISLDAFQNLIDEENGTLILADPLGKIMYVSQNANRQVSERVLSEVKERKEEGQQDRLLALTISDEDVTAFSYSSPLTGMKYAYYIQDSTFYADYKVKNRIFLMNFFVSILFNCLILVVLSGLIILHLKSRY